MINKFIFGSFSCSIISELISLEKINYVVKVVIHPTGLACSLGLYSVTCVAMSCVNLVGGFCDVKVAKDKIKRSETRKEEMP